jgi:predicted amidophosphoribosyltransferase
MLFGADVAVLLNLTSFGLTVVFLVVLLIVLAGFHRQPTRPCHECGAKVKLGSRVCPRCGYDFSPVRTSR